MLTSPPDATKPFVPGDLLYERIPVEVQWQMEKERLETAELLASEPDGRIVRERAEKMDLDISDADVNRMELALDAEHERFVTKEIERRKGVANQ